MPTFYNESAKNVAKTWVYLAFFSLFLITVGWVISWGTGDIGILYISVIIAVGTSFYTYWNSHKMVLKMSNAQPLDTKKYPEIDNIVENLAISEGLPKPDIYFIDENQPNAFATGRNPEHGVVAVTRGLIERLDRSELEAVIAHELSHIKNRDILVSTIAVVLAGAIAIISRVFLRSMIFGRRGNSEGKGNAVGLIIAVVVAIVAPLFAMMLRFAVSRKREYLADSTAVLMTRYPDALASALEKISSHPEELKAANEATANLYIANPLRGDSNKGIINKLFMTHPPVEERIKTIRNIDVKE